MKNIKFSIYRPSGNDTALVEQLIVDPSLKRSINNKIMSKYPNVEQVGFVEKTKAQLEMAGGEFCGNALRCAAFGFLQGKSGSILVQSSGVIKKLESGIDRLGNTWAQMPIYLDPNRITSKDKLYVVEMEGITQVIYYCKTKFNSTQKAKAQAFKILKSLGLDKSAKAAGVMFVSRQNGLSIEPVVWVRDIQTLFFETACASGTTAVALVETLKAGVSIENLPICQPSGKKIIASIDLADNKFSRAVISGQVELLTTDYIYV